jgi:hypothetical protein
MFVTPLDAKKEKVASNSFANKKFELKIKISVKIKFFKTNPRLF